MPVFSFFPLLLLCHQMACKCPGISDCIQGYYTIFFILIIVYNYIASNDFSYDWRTTQKSLWGVNSWIYFSGFIWRMLVLLPMLFLIGYQLDTACGFTSWPASYSYTWAFKYLWLFIKICEYLSKKLQKVYNNTAHLVLRVHKTDHISPHLVPLHWLSIDSWIQKKLTSLSYNCLSLTAPVKLDHQTHSHLWNHLFRLSYGLCVCVCVCVCTQGSFCFLFGLFCSFSVMGYVLQFGKIAHKSTLLMSRFLF